MARGRQRTAWTMVLFLLVAACSGQTSSGEQNASAGETAVGGVDQEPATTPSDPPPFPWELAEQGVEVPASVPLGEIRSGGPPPDGIPPIDEPAFTDVAAADEWLQPRSPVLLFELDGETRAYPLAILTFHEIVNDVVAGTPVVVTYCPLCNSGLVFERTVDGEVLSFGTSGRLWNSNLVMYDRSTRSLWSQFTGEAIVGERLGTELERLPMQIVAWDQVSEARPDAQVLSRETGHQRPYGQNPYAGYDSTDDPFLFDGETGGPLAQMERVVTTGDAAEPVAYPLSLLREERVVADRLDGEPVVAWWVPGTASALDDADIDEGKDVGATGLFRPRVDGRLLSFEPHGERRFRDAETGSTWTVLGRAVEGPLEGEQLERVPHEDTFWFVQYAFRPETRVVQSS